MKRCPTCGGACLPTQSFCPGCGSTLKAAALIEGDPYLGMVFANKYMVEEKLGEGGMGVVYKGRTLDVGRTVALKVLHERYSGDRSAIRRFTREANVASRLNHPNSISILDFGHTSSGISYLAMELLEGKSLQDALIEKEFSLARTINIMRQILSALEAAHALGIVHRDLKPANIYLLTSRSKPDHVKVLDFGIARLRRAGEMDRVTRTGMVCGTPEYMSPEQAGGQDTDARSDVYSAGLIFYEMLTGRRAFEGKSPAEIMAAQIHDMPPPPSQRNPDRTIPPSLDAIVMWALAKPQDERFASIREFHRVLKEWLHVSGKDFFKDDENKRSYMGKPPPTESSASIPVATGDIIGTKALGEETGTDTETKDVPYAISGERKEGKEVDSENIPTQDAAFRMVERALPDKPGIAAPPMKWKSPAPSACPFFGRKSQMHYLEKEVAQGGFQVYRFSGPVGVGKTRTAQELMARAAAEGRRPIRTLSPSWTVYEPLEAVQNVALQLLELPCEPVDRDVLATHLESAGYSETLLEGLSYLFLLGAKKPPNIESEADVSGFRIKRAQGWRSLIVEAARRQPLVLLFDEIEKMDGASKELLSALAAVETDAPLTILITHDESYFALWPNSVREVSVRTLDPVDAGGFARYLSQGELSDREAKEIAHTSQGNPLHIRELVAFRCLHEMDDPPEKLPDLIAARFNRLPREARTRMEIASVISDTVKKKAIATLESSMGTPFPEVDTSVAKSLKILDYMGFLTKESTHYTFLHGLQRMVVSTSIPAGVKKDIHKRAAHLLGHQGAGIMSLAHHHLAAGNDEESIQHLLLTGKAALSALDEEDAEFCYRRILEKIKGPDATLSGAQGKIWLEAVRGLAVSLKRSGEHEEAEQLLKVARRRATRIGWDLGQERLLASLQGVEQEKPEP